MSDRTTHAPSESYGDAVKYSNPLQNYSAKIASYVNRYAIIVEQEGVTVDKMYNFMKDLSSNDIREAIIWNDFIAWFLKDFNAQMQQENQKYKNSLHKLEQARNEKSNKALEAKVELLQLLTALGTALIAFILLTMILVLFKIESNTRKDNEVNEG